MPIKFTTESDLNGERVDVTVYEDRGGDGAGSSTDSVGNAYDNAETVTIGDGTWTTTLDTLSGGLENDYWCLIEPSTTDPAVTPMLTAVTLTVPTADLSISSATDAGVSLEWTAVTDFTADEYRILRASASGEVVADYTPLETLSGTTTTYTDATTALNETYYYRVEALAAGEQLTLSDEVRATPLQPSTLAVVGTQLRFTDEAGLEWAYDGELIETETGYEPGQIAVRGDYLEYIDESGNLRRAPRHVEMADSGHDVRQLIQRDSRLEYIDETGAQVVAEEVGGHLDEAHSDTPFADHDDHNDTAHDDVAFVDFSDHDDVSHSDASHDDGVKHQDQAHRDHDDHDDYDHLDQAHSDFDDYSDYQGSWIHGDSSHEDSGHGDFADEAFGSSHSDNAHFDHSDYEDDPHSDRAHTDIDDHDDTSHEDQAHVDSTDHNDITHDDGSHADGETDPQPTRVF